MHLWLRALVFALIAPGSVAFLVPLLLAQRGGPRTDAAWVHVAGAVALAAGAAGLAWCFALFVGEGRGTPAPYDPPQRLVRRGPYRWSRNPMYVAVLLVALGIAGLTGSALVAAYVAVLWVGFNLWVRAYEEPQLRRRFGADYDAYCAAVPRWVRSEPPAGRRSHGSGAARDRNAAR